MGAKRKQPEEGLDERELLEALAKDGEEKTDEEKLVEEEVEEAQDVDEKEHGLSIYKELIDEINK